MGACMQSLAADSRTMCCMCCLFLPFSCAALPSQLAPTRRWGGPGGRSRAFHRPRERSLSRLLRRSRKTSLTFFLRAHAQPAAHGPTGYRPAGSGICRPTASLNTLCFLSIPLPSDRDDPSRQISQGPVPPPVRGFSSSSPFVPRPHPSSSPSSSRARRPSSATRPGDQSIRPIMVHPI